MVYHNMKGKVIAIGTEWKEQWGTFTALQDAEVKIQPARNTCSDINYWLDGIRFFEGEYQSHNSARSYIKNGDIKK